MFLKILPLLFLAARLSAANLSLDWVLSQVEAKNPEVREAQADLRMAQALAAAAYAWPAPTLSIELQNISAPQLDLGSYDRRRFELDQSLPFFGRSTLAGRVATHQARREQAMARSVLEDKFLEARQAYWQMAGAGLALKSAEKALAVLNEMAGTSSSRERFGRLDRMGQMMDSMLGAQAAQMEAMLPQWRQERDKAEATLKRVMGTDSGQPLPDCADEIESLLDTVPPTEAELWQSLDMANPDLEEARHHVEHSQAMQRYARSGWLPDLLLEAGWEEDRSGANSDATLKAGMSLPWLWFSQQAGSSAAAGAELDHSRAALEAERLKLREAAHTQLGELQSSLAELKIAHTRALPKAEEAMKQGLSGFKAGSVDANQAMQAAMLYWDSAQRLSDLVARAGMSLAEIEHLMAVRTAPNAMEMRHE